MIGEALGQIAVAVAQEIENAAHLQNARALCAACAAKHPHARPSPTTVIGTRFCHVCSKLCARQGADFELFVTDDRLEQAHAHARAHRPARTHRMPQP